MALAVESMTEKQQEIFQLLMEGESYSDIAKITGKAFSTIYEQVESIRRILKKKAWLSFLSKE
jgi:DNA-binding NarL/FixJ family response regulator